LYSKFIVGWQISNTLTTDFCIDALEQGLKYALPEIVNSDQGTQYTSDKYTNLLFKKGIKISMDHKGRCFDNIIIERFWRNIKYEEIYRNEYQTVVQLRDSIDRYIYKYNYQRLHESIGYKKPADLYF
jgi:putative transposase